MSSNPMRDIRIPDGSKLWFTSDTHFCHQNIIRWCARPWKTADEMNNSIDEMNSEPDEEKGLGYKEYLMILMSLQGDKIYYRMLDLMQLNVTQPDIEGGDPNFRMSNAITAFGINSDVGYKSKVFNIHEEIGY